MKISFFFRAAMLLLFVSLFTSCSSDSTTPVEENNNTQEQYFSFNYNSTEYAIDSIRCERIENRFILTGITADNRYINISFNKYGKIINLNTMNSDRMLESNFGHDKATYFTFELVNLNEIDKTVECTFNGRLYRDLDDLQSPSKLVSGSFKVRYTENTPEVPGIHFDAKINGQEWYGSLNTGISTNPLYDDLIAIADNKYELAIRLPSDNNQLSTGTFTFNENTVNNKMFVRIFNPQSGQLYFTDQNTGTLTISSVTPFYDFAKTIEGTFSFTAKDPATNQTITVTNGSFKFIHSN